MSRQRLFSSLSLLPATLLVPQRCLPVQLLSATSRGFHATRSQPFANVESDGPQPPKAKVSQPNKLNVIQRKATKEKRKKLLKVRQTLNAAKKAVRDDMRHMNQDFLELTDDPNSFLGKIYTSEKVKEFTEKARDAGVITGASAQEKKRLFFENFEAAENSATSTSETEPLKIPLSHRIPAEESELVFQKAPQAEAASSFGTVGGSTEESLKICLKKAELVSKIVSLSLESERGVKMANISRAVEFFGRTEGDTGSPEVQCAVMSVKIFHMQRHLLSSHRKDFATKRRLQLTMNKRRKIMKYLKHKSQQRYYDALHKIGLKEVHYI